MRPFAPIPTSSDALMRTLLSHWAEDVVQQRSARSKENRKDLEAEDAAIARKDAARARELQARQSEVAQRRRDVEHTKVRQTDQTRAQADLARDRFVRQAELKDQSQRAELELRRRSDLGQEAADAALTAAINGHLEGLVVQASANDTTAVSLPTGVRVASGSIAGPPIDNIDALLAAAQRAVIEGRDDDGAAEARRSAAGALAHGLMPHPEDLARLLAAAGAEASTVDHFRSLGAALDRLDRAEPGKAEVGARQAGRRLDVVGAYCDALTRSGGGAVLALVVNGDGRGFDPAELPSRPGDPSALRQRELDDVLDGLFG
jgi:hypothetical protein